MKNTEYNFPKEKRHVYDIDVFEINDRRIAKYKSDIKGKKKLLQCLEFVKEDENFILEYFMGDGIDLTENQDYRNFIIPSNYNLYNTYLGYKILTMDIYKIEPMLSFQSVLFLGNYYAPAENFIGLVEFLTYDFVKARVLPTEKIRLEKIVNWVERNRNSLANKAYHSNEKYDDIFESEDVDFEEETKEVFQEKTEPIKSDDLNNPPKTRSVSMDPEFAIMLVDKLKPYFQEDQHILLYELIINNKNGKPLVFKENGNKLAELFKRLRYNKKIIVSTNYILATWITASFCIIEKGESKALNYNYILDVLKRKDKEPSFQNIILREIAEYKFPSGRKKEKIKSK